MNNKYGPFKVSIDHIWMKSGKVKVWISENPFSFERKIVSQEEMIINLKEVLKQLCCSNNHNLDEDNQIFLNLFRKESYTELKNRKNPIIKNEFRKALIKYDPSTPTNKKYQAPQYSLFK